MFYKPSVLILFSMENYHDTGIHLTYDKVATLNLNASGLKQQFKRLLKALGSNEIQENLMGSDLSL